MKTIIITPVLHHNKNRLLVKFGYDSELISLIKKVEGATFSATHKSWHVANNPENLKELFRLFKGMAVVDATAVFGKSSKLQVTSSKFNVQGSKLVGSRQSAVGSEQFAIGSEKEKTGNSLPKYDRITQPLNAVSTGWIKKFEQFLSSKRYSDRSKHTYLNALRQFFGYYNEIDPMDITNEDIHKFNHYYIVAQNYSVSFQRQVISSIKLFYRYTTGHRLDLEQVVYPKREKKLPRVVSANDIRLIIESCTNLKHKTILMTLYATGLRVSELLNLKITHIDSKRSEISIMLGKGKKDREVPLTPVLLKQLRTYYKAYRPKDYLFEGQDGGQYAASSINQVIKNMAEKAGVKKTMSAHIFRHSYATHMLEMGIDLRYIQTLLGHKSSKTTEIYTHVSNKKLKELRNPLDDLGLVVSEREIKYMRSNEIFWKSDAKKNKKYFQKKLT